LIINNNVKAIGGVYGVQNVARNAYAGNQVTSAKDEVVLSGEAKSFASMLQELSSLDEVREERVEELRAQVADGSYNVSAENVAASMLGLL